MDINWQFYQGIAETIKTYGQQIIFVGGDKRHTQFSYTIGNHGKKLPELLLIGPGKPEWHRDILNSLSEKLVEQNQPFEDGQKVEYGAKYPVQIWNATNLAQNTFTIQASQFYGTEKYKVQQVVLADKDGLYPPDPKVRKPFKVPLLRATSVLLSTMKH